MMQKSRFAHVPIIILTAALLFWWNKIAPPPQDFLNSGWSPSYKAGNCVSFINSQDEEIIIKIEKVNFTDHSYFSSIENVPESKDYVFELRGDVIEEAGNLIECPKFYLPESEDFI